MLVVRTAELSRKHLEKMGITLQGHIARMLHSLAEAKAEDTRSKNERLEGMQKAVTSKSIAPYPVEEFPLEESTSYPEGVEQRDNDVVKQDLLHGQASYSAHYLGSMEISNIDGTEESRRVMTELKERIVSVKSLPKLY
ncbi:hypothetical protein ANCCAN_11890 [Ancylostoma caninum]|uniref:SAM domain-containing protein n=1 Tax=Ancylostoma caninum TaxID=29170 RepID=A0A368GER0_ANCCA|nr:hypothetical protein ANCCAN_11890 [Ancylostoma caninum]